MGKPEQACRSLRDSGNVEATIHSWLKQRATTRLGTTRQFLAAVAAARAIADGLRRRFPTGLERRGVAGGTGKGEP